MSFNEIAQGPHYVDSRIIKELARDLKAISEEAVLPKNKAFFRSFIKRVTIDGTQAKIEYTLPVPPEAKRKVTI